MKYKVVICAIPGKTLIGGLPYCFSTAFSTLQEAQEWIYAMVDGNRNIDKIEIHFKNN